MNKTPFDHRMSDTKAIIRSFILAAGSFLMPESLQRSETIEPVSMPNSTSSANEAMSIIARRIAERATAINLAPAAEIGPMCKMVTTFLDQMMTGISSTEVSRLLHRMIDRIDFLGDNLLQNVNPPAQRTAFQDHLGLVFARFNNGRSVHLELGVWTAWPDERVQQHVGPDKLGDIIRLDMNPTFPVDVAASVTALPFRDNSIDCISSNSLFEPCTLPS